MKKCIFLFLLFTSAIMASPITTDIQAGPDTYWWTKAMPQDKGWQWMQEANRILQSGFVAGTGNIFYVDSNVTTEGPGTSWTTAKNTLDEAINLCTASNGDVIYVAPGHAETIAAANGFDADVIGITIIGCGTGNLRPTFTFSTTDSTIAVGAADVTIENLRFVCGVSAVVTAISVEAAGDYCTIEGCEFVDPATSTYEFYDMIKLATAADFCTIRGNRFISTVSTAGCNQAIDVDTGIVDSLQIIGNEFQGNFVVAAIHSSRVNTNTLIAYNKVYQSATGQFAIEFTAAATGLCIGNNMYSDAYATTLDPGSLTCFENYAISTIDKGANLIPLTYTATTYATGVGFRDVLAYIQDGVRKGSGTAMGANKGVADALGTDGVTVTDSTVSVLGAIGANSANNSFDSSTVVGNTNGSVLERQESIAQALGASNPTFTNPNYLVVRAPTSGSFDTTGVWSTAAAHEILTVTGCVRMLIIPECIESIVSASDTGTVSLGDETNVASIIAASTAGSGVWVLGELWTDATLTRTILTQTQLNANTFVVCAGKDIGYTIATNALTDGAINFHVWWVPLDATGLVVAGGGGVF